MKKAVYYILLAVFIGVFLFAAYQIGSYMLEKHKSDEVLKDAGKYVYIPDLKDDKEPEQEGEPEQVYVDFAALEASRAYAQVANDRDWAAQYFPSVLRARLERAAHHASGADAA